MQLWRISAYPGLSGEGGMHVAGRWHSQGHRVLYAAEHPALAMIELLAHQRLSLTSIPKTLKLIRIDVKEGAAIEPTPPLPTGWQANEPTSQALGDQWLSGAQALLMALPSAILANATNYLINPGHPQAKTHLAEGQIEPFWFDPRFLR